MFAETDRNLWATAATLLGGIAYFGMVGYFLVRAGWARPEHRKSNMLCLVAVPICLVGSGLNQMNPVIWMVLVCISLAAGYIVMSLDARKVGDPERAPGSYHPSLTTVSSHLNLALQKEIKRDIGYVLVTCLIISGINLSLGRVLSEYMFCRTSEDFMNSDRYWEVRSRMSMSVNT